jgi:monovalent cation:H+ antiporter-2, CPA2 family
VVLDQPGALLGVLFVIVIGKSLAAFVIVLAFGYTVRTALTISASLAQIGEFSFILASLGIGLNLMPPEARDLILAGALLSITLNPFAFAVIEPLTRWINARPKLLDALEREQKRIATPADVDSAHMRNHAVIVGFGRVGSIVGHALAAQGLDFVVVEMNRRAVEQLRTQGIPTVYGDATAHGVLAVARIESAKLLVIASPDGFQARRILEIAREKNPKLAVVVRTHSSSELAYLIRKGVDRAVMGELELALEMTDYALRSLGVSEERSKLVTQWLRTESVAGVPKDPNPS